MKKKNNNNKKKKKESCRLLSESRMEQLARYILTSPAVTPSRTADNSVYTPNAIARISSRRLLISFALTLFPEARPELHIECGTRSFTLKAASEYLPIFSLAITGHIPPASASLFLR